MPNNAIAQASLGLVDDAVNAELAFIITNLTDIEQFLIALANDQGAPGEHRTRAFFLTRGLGAIDFHVAKILRIAAARRVVLLSYYGRTSAVNRATWEARERLGLGVNDLDVAIPSDDAGLPPGPDAG